MKKFLVLLLLAQSTILFAQIKFEKRIEFDVKDEDFIGHEVHLYGEDGFLIRSRWDKSRKEKHYKYDLYDTDLNVVKSHIEENDMGKIAQTMSYENETHLVDFFYEKNGATKVVTVEGKTLKSETFNLKLPGKITFVAGELSNEKVYRFCYIKKKPNLIIVDWHKGTHKVIPILIKGYRPGSISFENISITEKGNEAFLTVVGIKGKEKEYYLFKISPDDKFASTINLSKSLKKNLTSLTVASFEEDKYILTGTYSTKATSMSEGIYYAELDGNKISFIEYHNFLDLENFLSYLSEKKQDKIEKKKKSKAKSGKELKLLYNIAGHDLIKADDAYYYIGEAYYPTYRTETYTTTDANGRTTTHTRTVFDGYQYTHATVVKYSDKGEILWDRTFEMWPNYKPFFVKRFIKVNANVEENLSMAFASRNRIKSISFSHDGETIKDETSEEITTEVKGDKTKYSFTNMDGWYDNYFLAYGSQVIKNKGNDDVKKKRWVYFIQKISY